jgi:hypothetical protein
MAKKIAAEILKSRIEALRDALSQTSSAERQQEIVQDIIDLLEVTLKLGGAGRPRKWSSRKLLQLERDHVAATSENPAASPAQIWKILSKQDRYKELAPETLRRRMHHARRAKEEASTYNQVDGAWRQHLAPSALLPFFKLDSLNWQKIARMASLPAYASSVRSRYLQAVTWDSSGIDLSPGR